MFSFSFFSISGQSIDLDHCDIEQFALETNRDHSVIFEIAPKYFISDSFVDYEGYSISSKGSCPHWLNVISGVSVRVFPEEINIGIGRLSKADGPPQCE